MSEEVVFELSDQDYPQREDALQFIDGLRVLPLTAEVSGLATVLIRERVMPDPLAGDAMHVAAATVHHLEYVLSWNVRHLANSNKVRHLNTICLRLGMVPPRIITPEFLWEDDR